jgi:hypothetical protein
MSIARILSGTFLFLIAAAASFGQAGTYVVKQPTADVTSGAGNPSLYYVTNRLHQGDRVEVVREAQDGWLAIKAPAGSVSWINNRFLKPVGRDTWSVESLEDAPVYYASEVRTEKPNVRSLYLTRGTLVEKAANAKSAEDGMWQPIKSPAAELRYIRAADVTPQITASTGPAAPVTSQADPVRPPKNFAVPPVATPSVEPLAPANARWAEAQKAEKEGRIKEAIELYEKLGQEVANTDHELSTSCINKASWLRHKPGYAVGNRLQPVAAGTSVGYSPQAGGYQCTPSEYTFYGRLRQAYQSLDQKPTYVVENNQGIVAYVTSNGADLNALLGHNVAVSGPACWCGSVRANYVRATRAAPLQ